MSARRRTVLPSRTPRGFADVGRAFSQQTWQSPSVGRSRLGSSQTPAALPQKQTAFPGFNNSFAVQSPSGPSQAVLRRQRGASQMPGFSQARSQRESSMGPPPLPRKLPRTTTPRQSQRQASQRMASQAPSPVRSQKGKQVERSSDAVDTPADALMSEDAMDDEAASQDGEPDSVNSVSRHAGSLRWSADRSACRSLPRSSTTRQKHPSTASRVCHQPYSRRCRPPPPAPLQQLPCQAPRPRRHRMPRL